MSADKNIIVGATAGIITALISANVIKDTYEAETAVERIAAALSKVQGADNPKGDDA